ncbi:efflux RND transporter periplasmic adaptor subunit [Taibaiella chishuiensis]|uniref:RND family efflux transporter MFP subunit n=1 Tax=Taibaiella chishuiensis TaxID=1434707 RepID=A0A2P8D8F9_9BACT|nr:efflux RND transporter periplasmic adaptor subunit [Taibaiella chishuiensis]PSK93508.1 RND family efflux transporter MFP subunit [Taibaiella chishuiensis]
MKKIKKNFAALLTGAVLLLAVAFTLGNNKKKLDAKAATGSTKTIVFPVTIATPQYRDLGSTYTASGFFVPVNSMALTSDITGRITSTSLKDGVSITKGQVLVSVYNEAAHIEKRQNEIDRQLAAQTLQKAKTDLAKMEDMLQANAITGREVEEQRLSVESALSKLRNLNTLNRATTITAPMSGTVHKAYVQAGSYLSPGTVVADLVDNSSLKLQVLLLDKEVSALGIGKKIAVSPDLYPGYTVTGTVVYIAAQADANRNFPVEIQIPNSNTYPLKAGMSGVAQISNTHPQQALMIPVQSIVGSFQQPQVYVLQGNTAVLRKITTGVVQGENIVVLAGLTTTDQVIRTGQLNISNGSAVQVIP